MGNTPAQDLAYERVQECQGVSSNVIFQRIESDGRVWVEMRIEERGSWARGPTHTDARSRRRPRISRAAFRPGVPITPPPGCAAAPHRYRPLIGVRYRA